jgi:hypothetical protein
VHRSTRRRFIAILALLSHLMAALFVHVPMAYASMSAAVAESAATTQPPCPEHMKMAHGAANAAQASDHANDHESGCKSGLCKCACAHAQGLALIPMLTPTLVAHSPAVSSYRVPLVPDGATSFFRPPI